MSKIIFEFPKDGPQDFYSSEGYAEMQVIDGKLELDTEPGEALLNLINRFEGKRVVVEEKKTKAKSEISKKDDS